MTDGLIDQSEPLLSSEPSVALATLVAATGSTSKKVGTKMIVGESGRLIGGVTIGGCVDAQVVEAADALLEAGGRRVLSISLDDDEAWGSADLRRDRRCSDRTRQCARHRRPCRRGTRRRVACTR
jgi:xanthine dehydrogenase accessory factor